MTEKLSISAHQLNCQSSSTLDNRGHGEIRERSCKNQAKERAPPKRFTSTPPGTKSSESIKINEIPALFEGVEATQHTTQKKIFQISNIIFCSVWLFVLILFLDLSWWHGWRWLEAFRVYRKYWFSHIRTSKRLESQLTRYHDWLLSKHSRKWCVFSRELRCVCYFFQHKILTSLRLW